MKHRPQGRGPSTCAGLLLPLVLLLALPTGGCASTKLLRLENEVLKNQNSELRDSLAACEADAPPPDYATVVTLDVVQGYLERAGFTGLDTKPNGVLTVQVSGRNTTFTLNVQLFSREKVLFLAVSDYLRLEDATTSSAMVLLLTQLASLNYDLLLGKFQLNPRTGEISFSVELNLDDGLGFRTLKAVSDHLVRTADERYPELLRSAQGTGL